MLSHRIVSLLVLSALSLVACKGDKGHRLDVDLLTELVASQEFKSVETEIVSNDDPTMGIRTLATIESNATFGDPFPRGHKVASFEDVEAGEKTVRVRLRTASGQILIERRMKFTMDGDYTLTVPLTRDCVGVMCPAPGGSPGLLACLGGQCVDERCDPAVEATRQYCPNVTFCNMDTDCTSAAACATSHCQSGLCLAEEEASACGEEEYCDPSPTGGCRQRSDLVTDGGVDSGTSPVCNTICFSEGQPCIAGFWRCDEDGGVPECDSLTPVSSGTSCGTGLVCDGAGACVASPDGGV